MKNTLVTFTIALIALLVILPLGCAHQSAATKQAVSQLQAQGAVKLQTAKNNDAVKLQTTRDANQVNKENGKDAPATHPIAATNNTVAELHGILLVLTIVSGIAFAVAFGLSYSSFTLFTPLIPPLRLLFVLFAVALFTLPFLPVAIFAIIGAALGLFIYEIVRAKGNVSVAIQDEEADLGFAPASSNAPAGVTTTQTTVTAVQQHTTATTPHTLVGEKA